MRLTDDNGVDDQIRASVSDTVPPVVESRLRGKLLDFKSRLSAEPSNSRVGLKRRAWRVGITTCAAASLILAMAILLARPQIGFADVAKAVFDKPWIHMRITTNGQTEVEGWFSPAKNISASKSADAFVYEDYRLRVSEKYDTNTKEVTRIPIVWKSPHREFETTVAVLASLLQENQPATDPRPQFSFLGPEREKMKLIEQRMNRVTEGGKTWFEYQLKVADPASTQPIQLFYRVDVATKLPVLCRVSGQWDGKTATRETQFDYPDNGPADLYALGVPRTTKLVDRVPDDDVQRILDTIKAGRQRMDDYRAVFVKNVDMPEAYWWTSSPIVFYRKGTKYRADYPCESVGNIAATKRPKEGEDLGTWWRGRTKSFRYYPLYVVRDGTTFTSNLKSVTDPDGTTHSEIASVSKMESGNNLDEIYPPESSMRPELACRPPMGVGHPDLELVVDMHPTEGPVGCILLKLRHTSTKDRVNEKGIGIPDNYRYWVDPKRDYIMMRSSMIVRDAAGKEQIIETDDTEEVARSPQGVWYATKIRRKFPDREGKNKSPDEIYSIYVDFNPELADSFFEPPVIGKIR